VEIANIYTRSFVC